MYSATLYALIMYLSHPGSYKAIMYMYIELFTFISSVSQLFHDVAMTSHQFRESCIVVMVIGLLAGLKSYTANRYTLLFW